MNYVPQLNYVFNLASAYAMEPLAPLLQYLNACGVTPGVLAGEPQVCANLGERSIDFRLLQHLPDDYDVMLAAGMGYAPFERYWLERSMAAGKINVQAEFASMPANFEELFFVPRRMKFIHGLCTWDRRTIEKIRRYNKEIFFLVTGSCTWDRYRTDEFKGQVAEIKRRYGDRLLVIGVSGLDPEKEIPYYHMVCACAESLGFRVILQIHPGKAHLFDGMLEDYRNPGIDRHALFAASSHVIGFIFSVMTIECLHFGVNVGCKPLAAHYEKWRNCPWLDEGAWRHWAHEMYDETFLDRIPLVHDEKSLERFLVSDCSPTCRREVADILGWPVAENYCAEKFRVIESCLGRGQEANVERVLTKNRANRGLQIDFSFADIEQHPSIYRGASGLADFVRSGLFYLQQDNYEQALLHMNRAVMFSGLDQFDTIQYVRTVCYLKRGELEKAAECIYQALYINPGKDEYLRLCRKIEEARDAAVTV